MVNAKPLSERRLAFGDCEAGGADMFGVDHGHNNAQRIKPSQCPLHYAAMHPAFMTKICDRLIQAREKRYQTASDAARAMNIPVPTYAGHENGSRGIPLEAAARYASFFRVSLDWLVLGKGPAPKATGEPLMVPRLSWVSAGEVRPHEPIERMDDWPKIEVCGLSEGDWIALDVEGDSMDRISPPGSRIFVNRQDRRLVANACYVIADEHGAATYKRYRPNPVRFEPVSTNQAHEAIYPDNEPVIIGRVRRSTIDF